MAPKKRPAARTTRTAKGTTRGKSGKNEKRAQSARSAQSAQRGKRPAARAGSRSLGLPSVAASVIARLIAGSPALPESPLDAAIARLVRGAPSLPEPVATTRGRSSAATHPEE